MRIPLQVLAVGAVVAGFVGIPPAIWADGNVIEKFLEPSFTAERAQPASGQTSAGEVPPSGVVAAAEPAHGTRPGGARTLEPAPDAGEPVSRGVELGLMLLSVAVAVVGIGAAWKFYVASPEISERLAVRFAWAHRILTNKYYVDELYGATVVSGTFGLGRGLWAVDRNVVDGVVNGTSWVTIVSAWISGLTDRAIVDGAVNLVARICEEGSFWFRKLQTGLVQNYALVMVFGVFAFVTVYLVLR